MDWGRRRDGSKISGWVAGAWDSHFGSLLMLLIEGRVDRCFLFA